MPIDVLMLEQRDCAFCDHANEILCRLEKEYPLVVRRLDINTEQGRRFAQEGGVMFAPGIFIDGEPFCYGRLSERKLRRQLASHRHRLMA